MTMLDTGLIALPTPSWLNTLNSNSVINASGEKKGNITQVPKSGTVNSVRVRFGNITTGATVRVRLETVDTTNGCPSGTLISTGAEGSVVVADTDDNSFIVFSLDTPASVTEGDYIAVVVEIASGSPSNLNVYMTAGFDYVIRQHFPYIVTHNGTSWNAKSASWQFHLSFGYSGDSQYTSTPFLPIGVRSSINIRASVDPVAVGNRFKLPFGCRFRGWWSMMAGNSTADVTWKLAEDDGTLLSSFAYDANVRASTTAPHSFWSPTQVTLVADTYYRVYGEGVSTTSDPVYITTEIEREQAPGLDDWQGQRLDTFGTWTNLVDTNTVANVGIWIDPIEGGTAPVPVSFGY